LKRSRRGCKSKFLEAIYNNQNGISAIKETLTMFLQAEILKRLLRKINLEIGSAQIGFCAAYQELLVIVQLSHIEVEV
jgi:hypothetical protein